jgi:glycosyltransferase involved in cell wall biosynthesis
MTAPQANGAGRISVVIPAYNAAAHLAATLKSVCQQTTAPAEVIVVDDGSTDDTGEIARSFGARVLRVANGGPSAARNAGTQSASGQYIAYLDADDVWLPDKLATQLAELRCFGAPAFSFTDYRMFDERGVHRCKSELLRRFAFRRSVRLRRGRTSVVMAPKNSAPVLYDSYIVPSSLLVRRADVLAIGGFDQSLRVTEDYEFLLRLFRIVPAVVVLKPLVLYRQHGGQATSNSTLMRTGFFEVAKRVAASPQRYPAADVRYIGRTEYLRHRRLGVYQLRLGRFQEAALSFERSLSARPTAPAALALLVAKFCGSPAGRRPFDVVRALWKRRPGRR